MRLQGWSMVMAIIATSALAGCADTSAEEQIRKQRADVTEVLGGIEGIVTDDAFQPVVGGNVTLIERDMTTRTASDGSYAFSRVIPGVYTLSFSADGFVSATQTVTVVRNEVSALDFVVTHLASEEAYRTVVEKVGFLECGYAWSESVTGQNVFGLAFRALAVCAVPTLVTEIAGLGSNATNDRFFHSFQLDAPIETLVYEMDWVSNNPTGDSALRARVEVLGFANVWPAMIVHTAGPPPRHVVAERAQFEELQGNFTTACEEEGEDAFCGYNFFEDGWDMQVRVFASPGCTDLQVQLCPQIQQEFTHFISGFYNAAAPEGYSIVQGTN